MTIKDIAELASVSTATVSNVLNKKDEKVSEEVRKRVNNIIQQHDYVPNRIAKSLRKNKTDTIGVITEDIGDFAAPKILKGIDAYVEDTGKNILLYDLGLRKKTGDDTDKVKFYQTDVDEAFSVLLSAKVDGIIYVAWQDRDVREHIKDIDAPIVYSFCYNSEDNQTWISYDNSYISEKLVKKVLEYGHEKIAIVSGGYNCRPAQERLEAYKRVLAQNNIPLQNQYIKHGDWSFSDGARIYKELMSLNNPPTAIVFMNDEMATGAVNESMNTDRKALDEVSIVGFNGEEYTRFLTPSITTVKIPLYEIGYKSAEQLVYKIENRENLAQRVVLDCELIERETLRKV